MAGLRYGDPEEVDLSSERIRRLSALLAGWVAEGETPTCVALVARRGVVVLHEAYGRLSPGPAAPALKLDAIFPVASTTKLMTAALAMCLVEDGLLGLNRPVQEYLPEFAGEGKEAVMVHHLLSHTAGLSDAAALEHVGRAVAAGELPPTPDMASIRLFPPYAMYAQLEGALRAPLVRPPGSTMEYSGLGYSLLGEILARVAGKPYPVLMRERLFEPLGMDDTHLEMPIELWHRVVKRDPAGPFAYLNERLRPAHALPQGGASSTAWDVARFAQLFLDGGRPLLSRASVAAITRNQVEGLPGVFLGKALPPTGWGFGWRLPSGHPWPYTPSLPSPRGLLGGGAGGSLVFVDPAEELVGVCLSVVPRLRPDGSPYENRDLFVDAVIGACRC